MTVATEAVVAAIEAVVAATEAVAVAGQAVRTVVTTFCPPPPPTVELVHRRLQESVVLATAINQMSTSVLKLSM